MKAKPLVEAVLYALAEMQHRPKAWQAELGIHARFGLMVVVPR